MGAPKGTDNFAKARREQMDANMRLVDHFLEKQRKKRVAYPSLSALAADIAEATALHRTTLTRKGSKYLKKLLTHLAEQPGASAILDDKDASVPLLKAKLIDARAEITMLKNQLRTVAAQVASKGDAVVLAPKIDADQPVAVAEEPDWYLAFADTATAFFALIERLNENGEMIRLDEQNLVLLDLAASVSQQVVVKGNRLHPLVVFQQRMQKRNLGA